MQALAIGEAAQQLGVSVATLRRWEKAGRLAADFRTPGHHRRYRLDTLLNTRPADDANGKLTLAYARVSCADQRADLDRQAERLRDACQVYQDGPLEVIRDLGSGLNCKKKGLLKLLSLICRGRVSRLVIENSDRLLRFGAELVFALCRTFGVEVVITEAEPDTAFETRLAEDVLAVITVMSARLYGQRSHARRQAQQAA